MAHRDASHWTEVPGLGVPESRPGLSAPISRIQTSRRRVLLDDLVAYLALVALSCWCWCDCDTPGCSLMEILWLGTHQVGLKHHFRHFRP